MEKILNNYIHEIGAEKAQVVLCKKDGSILFDSHYGKRDHFLEVMALIVGSVSATEQIAKTMSVEKNSDFMMSFANSSHGIFAMPTMSSDSIELYVILLFENELNPAQFKIKIRKICQYLLENIRLKENKKNLLFENITDDEIERMFEGCKV